MQATTRRAWKALVAVLGAASLVLLIGCGNGASSDEELKYDDGEAGANGALREGDGDDAAAPSSAESVDVDGGGGSDAALAATGDRKVIFETTLELAAEDVAARYYEIGDIARRLGGYTADSQMSTASNGDETVRARVTVRIPSERREDALIALREMDGVTLESEHTTSSEVTDEYTDVESRLRNLQRSEERYLELMDRAESVSDILAVGERLDSVRSEIERLQGRLQVLDDLVDFATVGVNLRAAEEGTADEDDSGFVAAWKDAWRAFGEAGSVGVTGAAWASAALIVVAPLALLAMGMRVAAGRRPKREA